VVKVQLNLLPIKKLDQNTIPTGQHFQKPNLQKVKLANGKTIQVCSRCRKKIKNQIAQ